jgi:hypothetical protein
VQRNIGIVPKVTRAAPARLRIFYTPSPTFNPILTPDPVTFDICHPHMENTTMDVLFIGGLAIFAALTYGLIAGCEKLMQFRRADRGVRS